LIDGPICGPSSFDYPFEWSGGANGNFYLKFPTTVSSWSVQVSFCANITTMSVWNGANIQCTGSDCTFTDAIYNSNQGRDTTLKLGFQVKIHVKIHMIIFLPYQFFAILLVPIFIKTLIYKKNICLFYKV